MALTPGQLIDVTLTPAQAGKVHEDRLIDGKTPLIKGRLDKVEPYQSGEVRKCVIFVGDDKLGVAFGANHDPETDAQRLQLVAADYLASEPAAAAVALPLET